MSDATLDTPPPRGVPVRDEAKTVAFRGGGFAPRPHRWVGGLVFAVLILIAEWGTRAGWISALTLPKPSDVLATFGELYQSGLLFKHLGPSLSRFAVGSFFGVSVGIAVGVLIGLFSYVRAGAVPLVAALFPIPKIALLPLFVIWFGIGEGSKYALIAFGTFTPTVVATYGAVDNVDRTLIRMGQSFGLSWWSIVRKIVLPGAMPGILSGLRISLAIAIIRFGGVFTLEEEGYEHAAPDQHYIPSSCVERRDIARAYHLALTKPLPNPCEVFHIFHDRPGQRFPIDKARDILGFRPQYNANHLWRRGGTSSRARADD